ncbi:MAG: transporter substrate-binding domain-containing protein [Desulfovibrionaceae bacterium]
MFHLLRAFLPAVLLFHCLAGSAWSLEQIIMVTDYWPPFRIEDKDGIGGIDRALLDEAGRRMGVEFVLIRMPWARCLLSLKQGIADGMTGLALTPQREKYIAYSKMPYYSCAPAFYIRKDWPMPPILRYEDLYGLTIGYTRDSAYFEPFDSDLELNKIAAIQEEQLIEMVLKGRWDVFIGTDCRVQYDLARLGLENKIAQAPYRPATHIDLYVGFSRKSPFMERLSEFNALLDDLVRSGAIRTMAAQYFKADKQNKAEE